MITKLFKSKGRIDGAAKKAPYPTQTGELMVPSIANTYTIEILQYVSMTSAVQYSQYLHNRMNCVDLDSRSAAGTLSSAHCFAISVCPLDVYLVGQLTAHSSTLLKNNRAALY